jgi:hypothetical protein
MISKIRTRRTISPSLHLIFPLYRTFAMKYSVSMIAKSSSYNVGEINAGDEVTATFELTNRGYSTLKIYRIYDDRNALEIVAPESVKASSNFTIKAKVKNTNKKENPVYTITMVTNSPTRPLINLFITGNIK